MVAPIDDNCPVARFAVSPMIKPVVVTLLRFLGMALLGIGLGFLGRNLRTGTTPGGTAANGGRPLKPLEHTSAFELFRRDVHPLLTREERGDSCLSCHDADGSSQLIFDGNPTNDFNALLSGGYLYTEGPDTLLARVSTRNLQKRMPKGKHALPWNRHEVVKLRRFLNALNQVVKIDGRADEQFPAALVSAYAGPVPQSLDNQFLTCWQLRGKIRTLFGDDWRRNGEDLFEKNLALFGGADFKERFNETAKASSSFLTALEMLSRDVADRAYTMKSGPFAGRPDHLRPPDQMRPADPAYRQEITRLYQALLFREPSDQELKQSFGLIRSVHLARDEIRGTDYDLAFELTVADPATGLKARQVVVIPISGDFHGFYQELVDESRGDEAPGNGARHVLGRTFMFKKGDAGQRLRLSNVNTFGNVSFHGVELRKTGAEKWRKLPVTDAAVQADGAWKIDNGGGFTSFEDGNVEKGSSYIVIPITVPDSGTYEVAVLWRRNPHNARNVLVEVFSQEGNTLAVAARPAVPPPGEAHFHYDSSADNLPHAELPAGFEFADSDFVEINNRGTRERVTASAVRFVPQAGGKGFLVDSQEAEGRENWSKFDAGTFAAYNQVGTPVQDEGRNKGERALRFLPSTKRAAAEGWNATNFYRVQIHFPGKAGNEQRVPVVVKARRSSPIIQLTGPARARGDSEVVLDASSSYTVQGGQLSFTWKQIDGPVVKLGGTGPVVRFTAPRHSPEQAAWVALCRALMRHPDFLFTRPPSVESASKPEEKMRLQLVKIALDLIGRPPSPPELARLARGVTLTQMVDDYLHSQEFKDFYFHRIRLHLESQGTASQDEPARLWCYLAFNDLPFQQILTADYTVDAQLRKQPRPAYHGQTGVLTMKGFIEGKPGLPHFNYAAQVAMLFLGYVFEVPPEVVEQREGSTAASTVDPSSLCYSCHKVLTPLAMQRNFWTDDGRFRTHDEYGLPIEASDGHLVEGYPFAGEGLEAFATQAVKKERFIRTLIDTHCTFYLGRQMRWRDDERHLYRRIWDQLQKDHFTIRSLIRTLLTSPEYLEGKPVQPEPELETSIRSSMRAHLDRSVLAQP